MRSTVVLDDDLFRKAKQRAAELGTSLSEVVNQALRLALAQPRNASSPGFKMVTYGNPRSRVHHEPSDFFEAPEEGASSPDARS